MSPSVHRVVDKTGHAENKSKYRSLFRPIRMDPIITGMWMMVALVNPSGMYPRKGVNAKITIIAPNNATWIMLRTLMDVPAFLLSAL